MRAVVARRGRTVTCEAAKVKAKVLPLTDCATTATVARPPARTRPCRDLGRADEGAGFASRACACCCRPAAGRCQSHQGNRDSPCTQPLRKGEWLFNRTFRLESIACVCHPRSRWSAQRDVLIGQMAGRSAEEALGSKRRKKKTGAVGLVGE